MEKMSKSRRDSVVDEKNDLESKISKIENMLADPYIDKNDEDVKLIMKQLECMKNYSSVLCERLQRDYDKKDTDYSEIVKNYQTEVKKLFNEVDEVWYHTSHDSYDCKDNASKQKFTDLSKRLANWKTRLYNLLEGK